MKNFIIFISFTLIIIFLLSFNFLDAKKHVDSYLELKENVLLIKEEHNKIEKNLLKLNEANFEYILLSLKKIQDIIYIQKNNKTYDDNPKLISDLNELQMKNKKFENYIFKLNDNSKEFDKYLKEINELQINKFIKMINTELYTWILELRDQNAKTNITMLFLFLVVIFLFSIYYFNEYKKNLLTSRFRSAIENSDNIIVITDYEQKIVYVNQSFTDSTGYALEEIKGKTPSILKSSVMPKTFYKDLNNTIYSGKKWQGEFINIDKNGKTRHEKGSILPIKNDKGKIEYFLSIKLDITKEMEAEQKIKEHEQTILHQSKMASMGEMLENIAHQWRQPLSTITTVTSGMGMQKEVNILSDEAFFKAIDTIMENSSYLSKTIDDFRNFFKSEKEHQSFNIKESIEKALNISNSKMKSKFIQNITSLTDISTIGIDGEIMQVVLNLYSNSADAFKMDDRSHFIFTELYEKNGAAVIKVRDNAGGIPKDCINKVFEPYFTTKHKGQGTGIGLYMSHEIIKNTFKGAIDVHNVTYEYDGSEQSGAEFIIKIPIKNS